ncbi:MAG: SDR family oxidoreductase [Pseudomonadota bacterium]|nr:SDR family oxidoreductase [Pseudomonadota bacterium]
MGERLRDRVIIVTGGRLGIGQAFAKGLAAQGAAVVVADLEPATETVAAIERAGGRATSLPCDVGDEGQVAGMVQAVLDAHGRIDGLVNNAGIYPLGTLEQTSLELWERVQRVNVTGSFLCARAVLPTMRAQGSGKIVNISSGTFWMGAPGLAAYVASKGAVVGLTRALSKEVGAAGIQVNAIAPGLTETPGVAGGIPDEMFDGTVTLQAIARRERPEDMVGAVVFLMSADSDFMTGQVMAVDGGLVHI